MNGFDVITVHRLSPEHVRMNAQFFASILDSAYLRNHMGAKAIEAVEWAADGEGFMFEAYDNGFESHLFGTYEVAGDALFITAISGQNFERAADTLETWLRGEAERLGCKRLVLCGRHAWKKVLKHRGFTTDQAIYTMEV